MKYYFSEFTNDVINRRFFKYFWLWFFFIRPFILIWRFFADNIIQKADQEIKKRKAENKKCALLFCFFICVYAGSAFGVLFVGIQFLIFFAKTIYHYLILNNFLSFLLFLFFWVVLVIALVGGEYWIFFRNKFIQADKKRKEVYKRAKSEINCLLKPSCEDIFRQIFVNSHYRNEFAYILSDSTDWRILACANKEGWVGDDSGFILTNWPYDCLAAILLACENKKLVVQVDVFFPYQDFLSQNFCTREDKTFNSEIDKSLDFFKKETLEKNAHLFLTHINILLREPQKHHFVFYVVACQDCGLGAVNNSPLLKLAGAKIDENVFVFYPLNVLSQLQEITKYKDGEISKQNKVIRGIWK